MLRRFFCLGAHSSVPLSCHTPTKRSKYALQLGLPSSSTTKPAVRRGWLGCCHDADVRSCPHLNHPNAHCAHARTQTLCPDTRWTCLISSSRGWDSSTQSRWVSGPSLRRGSRSRPYLRPRSHLNLLRLKEASIWSAEGPPLDALGRLCE